MHRGHSRAPTARKLHRLSHRKRRRTRSIKASLHNRQDDHRAMPPPPSANVGVTFAKSNHGPQVAAASYHCAATTVRGNRLPASYHLIPVEEFKRSLEIARIAAATPLYITSPAAALPTQVTSVTNAIAALAYEASPATTIQLATAQPPCVSATPAPTHIAGVGGEMCRAHQCYPHPVRHHPPPRHRWMHRRQR